MEKREAGMETIYDYKSGHYYHFDHKSGQEQRCNVKGDPIPKFLKGVSGFADTSERRRRGYAPEVEVLETDPDLPAIMQLPAKYCGYACCPRPGINMTAGAAQPYKLPPYLQPKAAKVGRVSTRATKKVTKGDTWNAELPSFLETLGSQFDGAMKMTSFMPESSMIRTHTDLAAVTARNRQVVMSLKGTIDKAMDELRDIRVQTEGRFSAKHPPWDPEKMRDKEEKRSRLVNPDKWAREDQSYLVDKQKVMQRRRDRYPSYFKQREEQEAGRARVEQGGGPAGSEPAPSN